MAKPICHDQMGVSRSKLVSIYITILLAFGSVPPSYPFCKITDFEIIYNFKLMYVSVVYSRN